MNKQIPVRVSFHGAAGTVTGSKFLVEAEDKKILVDCGLFQGKKSNREMNWKTPTFEPSELSAIVLTHAHIDHSGYLPLVVKKGFSGPIYCTPPTKALLHLLLLDAAHIQEEDARFANKHGTSRHKPALPLFTEKDAKATLTLLKTMPMRDTTEIFPSISVSTVCAGHILGATSFNLDIYGKRITFSGDLGRYDVPILPDPEPLEFGDLLLCESTYGDREHALGDTKRELASIVKLASLKRGPLLIPSFAVGRTQTLLYLLAELEREGEIPVLPTFVDSPMAVDATQIYLDFRRDYDEEAAELIEKGERPLHTENLTFCSSRNDSKALNNLKGPRIIISASGMVTGGRIMHHMMRLLPEEETTVLFVGYQAEGTRGRIIESGAKDVKIYGQHVPIKAEICNLSGLSAHGDKNEMTRWLKSCGGNPGQVKIVHGEKDASRAFSEHLREEFSWDVSVAEYLEGVEV